LDHSLINILQGNKMKKSELQQIIKEEIRKVLSEASAPAEAQEFANAAKKKFKDALLGVDYFKSSGRTIVTAHVDIKKWTIADKYWANKYTKTLGNNTFEFATRPHPASAFKKADMSGTEVLSEESYISYGEQEAIDMIMSDKEIENKLKKLPGFTRIIGLSEDELRIVFSGKTGQVGAALAAEYLDEKIPGPDYTPKAGGPGHIIKIKA